MGFFTGMAGTAIRGIGKSAVGGTAGRMALGAGIGATYGVATNPYDNPNMGMGWIAKHALYGGALGGLSRLVTPSMKFTAQGVKMSGTPAAFRAIPSAARTAYAGGRGAATGAGLAMRYPAATVAAGAGIIAAGMYQFDTQTSPTQNNSVSASVSNLQLRTDQAMLEQMDSQVAPGNRMTSGSYIRAQQMAQSTQGLVQGLHAGRHS
jgi:hypothetical protein